MLSRPWAVRVATAGLWILVVGGVALGATALAARAESQAPGATADRPSSSAAEGFAEMYVAVFLQAGEGTEQELIPFYPERVDLTGVVPRSLYVARTASLGAEAVRPGYWSVTVAADVLRPTEGGYAPAGLRRFTIGVLEVSGALAATSLPAEVSVRSASEAPALEVPPSSDAGDDPAAEALTRFLDAFLTGQGELARYVAPGAPIASLNPPPYVDVDVAALGFGSAGGGVRLASARVGARDADGGARFLDYSMEISERAGRWEVVRLLEAPPLKTG